MTNGDLEITPDIAPVPTASIPSEEPDHPVHTPKPDETGKIRYGKRGNEKGVEPKPLQCSVEVYIPGGSWQCPNPHLPGNTLCADHARA